MKRGLDGSPDMIRTRAYSNGILEESDFQVTHVSEHLARDGVVVWVL